MSTVGNLMTPNPVVVACEAPLSDVARVLAQNRVRQLPVVDVANGQLMGLIRAQDVSEHGRWTEQGWRATDIDASPHAGDLARPAEVVAHRDERLVEVLQRQAQSTTRVVIVVDGQNRPIGIVTEHDGVRLAQQLLAAESDSGLERANYSLGDGRYELTQVIGQGGMATVYKAWDHHLELERAIKVLKPSYSGHSDIQRRFELEARTIARLQHENIVTVHDVQLDDRAFMVMELLSRGSLTDWCDANGAMPPRMAVQAMCGVLEGLSYAHHHGVVHRDVKPRNVMLTETGVPKLADFGIAHVVMDKTHHTRTGVMLGTESYMAPEQRTDAGHIDARADVYAAGATLFALITRTSPVELPLPQRREALLARLEVPLRAIVDRATRYDREERYETAEELRDALDAILPHLPEPSPATPPLGARVPTHPRTVRDAAPFPDHFSDGGLHHAADTMPFADLVDEASTVPIAPPEPPTSLDGDKASAPAQMPTQVAMLLGAAMATGILALAWLVLG